MIGDHTDYFDNVHAKDACKLKVCSIVENAGSTVDTANAAKHEVVLTGSTY